MQNEELEIIRMSEIQTREVKWLWYPYIPFGKRSMLIGFIPTAVLIVWELIRHIFLLT